MSLTKEVLQELLEKTIAIKISLNQDWFEEPTIEEGTTQYPYSIKNWCNGGDWCIDHCYKKQREKCNKLLCCYEIQDLNDIIEQLLTHISYQPGGLGMIEAKNHFEKKHLKKTN